MKNKLSPQERSAIAKARAAKKTSAELSEIGKKAARTRMAKLTPEERTAYLAKLMAARWAKSTPEEKSALAKTMNAARMAKSTRKQRSAIAKKAALTKWAKLAPVERSEIARKNAKKGWAKFNPEERRTKGKRNAAARMAKSTRKQRSAIAKKAAAARIAKLTPEKRSEIGSKVSAHYANLKAKAARLDAIENGAAVLPGSKRTPGPNRDIDTAKRVFEIVETITGDSRRWRGKLDDICDALDSAKVPCPSTWMPKQGINTWCRAAISQPALAIRAIEARLNNARNS
jgi:hypothetical protein